MAMEAGGKGSFQAVKLQRPARTTVCSHSIKDMAAVRSIESSAMITTLRTGVCPVVHSHKVRKEPHAAFRFEPTRDHFRVGGNLELGKRTSGRCSMNKAGPI